eukprot:2206794-Pleurochrysis_carterae.AAC.2
MTTLVGHGEVEKAMWERLSDPVVEETSRLVATPASAIGPQVCALRRAFGAQQHRAFGSEARTRAPTRPARACAREGEGEGREVEQGVGSRESECRGRAREGE